MDILHSNRPADVSGLDAVPLPSTNAQAAQTLVARCPVAAQTPLLQAEAIAVEAGVAEVWVKDERGRMGLGSFKALGAAYVIACDKERGDHRGRTYVTASAGNHGMSQRVHRRLVRRPWSISRSPFPKALPPGWQSRGQKSFAKARLTKTAWPPLRPLPTLTGGRCYQTVPGPVTLNAPTG